MSSIVPSKHEMYSFHFYEHATNEMELFQTSVWENVMNGACQSRKLPRLSLLYGTTSRDRVTYVVCELVPVQFSTTNRTYQLPTIFVSFV